MTQERIELRKISTPIIEVLETGQVKVLRPDISSSSHPYPTKPGIYQLRPVARDYSASSEHGSWSPIYGWGRGILEDEEMPSLMELPSRGLENT